MYFIVRDGVTIKKIYKVKSNEVFPYIDKYSSGSDSIHAHVGFNENKITDILKGKVVYGF
jgi:hypothetical protein